MKHILFPCLLALLLLVSCKSNESSARKTKVQSDFLLEITHTGCRGQCPVFSYSVTPDGKVAYEGRRAVEQMGKWTKTIETGKVSEMLNAVNQSGFWKMEEVYGGEVADLPSVIIKVTHAGVTKQVQNIRNAPEAFTTLQTQLETLIGKEGFTQVAE